MVRANRATLRHIAHDPDFDVTVVAPRLMRDELRTIEFEPEPNGSPLRVVEVDAYLTKWIYLFFFNPFQVSRLLRDGPFDVVHIWEEPYVFAGFQISEAVHRRGLPFCFHTNQNIVKRYPPPFRYFERAVWRWSTAWAACASLVFEEMVRKGLPEETGRVLTLAVDATRFRPFDDAAKDRVAARLGLHRPLIGFIGRLTEAKGCEVLLELLRRLDPAAPWSLLLIGSGPYHSRFEALADALGISDRVAVKLLRHDEVPDVLPACDMLLAPSQTRANWREQLGRMTIEAFAAGVPVVASDSGEIPFVVGGAGLVVREDDLAGWVASVEALLQDGTRRRELAGLGLKRVERYTTAGVAPAYKEFYRWLHERGARRVP